MAFELPASPGMTPDNRHDDAQRVDKTIPRGNTMKPTCQLACGRLCRVGTRLPPARRHIDSNAARVRASHALDS
ncbi:hypothetical protein [Burkholderia perseverans]|uniref:hypothetical protein n=1 Tax=Burkholderia perseverans TaxID=2615214 RepID=UPI001FED499A|nr:hypothetical protein [Burkholderia perseverans]